MGKELDPNRVLTPAQLKAGVSRLERRLQELKDFDPGQANTFSDPDAKALSTSIENSLDVIFGENTRQRRRYASASNLCTAHVNMFEPTPAYEIIQGYRDGKASAIRLLTQAIEQLVEEISYLDEEKQGDQSEDIGHSLTKVFVVHGHDELAKQEVARFLERVGLEAIILHEQVSQGRTIIEKLEQFADVSFAVVLLTPDDKGAGKDAKEFVLRARQNVVLELGYFLGRLGRDRVCAIKKSSVEVPGDFDGVVYTDMDERGAWKLELAGELKAAGMKFDANALL